jgi:hypothetical protein
MSAKPSEPKSKIEDLSEKSNELSAEELENVAGGIVRSPGTTKLPVRHAPLGASATTDLTITINSDIDTAAD